MTDVSNERVLVIVFGMTDCPACEEYIPRFMARARPFQTNGVPVFVYDVASPDPRLQAFADRYEISGTPTTLVLPRGKGFIKVEGVLDDHQIDDLLRKAYGIHMGTATVRMPNR